MPDQIVHTFGGTVAWSAQPGKLNRNRMPKPKPGPAQLTERLSLTLTSRIERAIQAGRIELVPDDGSGPQMTLCTFAAVLHALLPEEFPEPPEKLSMPTNTAPGTAERIEEYRRRAARGEPLKRDGDADPVEDDRRHLKGHRRLNGSGPQMDGWHETSADVCTEGD